MTGIGIEEALAFADLPPAEPGCEDVDRAVRGAALEALRIDVRRQEDEFLVDTGDYGYGGEWFPRKDLNEYAIAEWALGLLQRQREAFMAALDRALDCKDNDEETA